MRNNKEEKEKIGNSNENLKDEEIGSNNRPYLNLGRKNPYNSYSALCGVRPFSRDYLTTTSDFYNKELEKMLANNGNNEFYQKEKEYAKAEMKFLKNNTKRDHIKKIFGTLNFKTQSTTYNETFYFDKEKETVTNEQDHSNHYKKSFMKTYEDIKHRHSNFMRK